MISNSLLATSFINIITVLRNHYDSTFKINTKQADALIRSLRIIPAEDTTSKG
jgi:hypothetical protein